MSEIEKYERFLEEQLKVDYAKVLNNREKVLKEMEEYENLLLTIEKLDETKHQGRLKTRVNLGKDVFANAVVEKTDRVIVRLSEGLFASLTRERAKVFISGRLKWLEGESENADELASKIRAQIDLVLGCIADYYKLEPAKKK